MRKKALIISAISVVMLVAFFCQESFEHPVTVSVLSVGSDGKARFVVSNHTDRPFMLYSQQPCLESGHGTNWTELPAWPEEVFSDLMKPHSAVKYTIKLPSGIREWRISVAGLIYQKYPWWQRLYDSGMETFGRNSKYVFRLQEVYTAVSTAQTNLTATPSGTSGFGR